MSLTNLLAQHWHVHCADDGTTTAVPDPAKLARSSPLRSVLPADVDAALATWVAAGAVQILRSPYSPQDPSGLIRWIPPPDDDPTIDISFPCRPRRGESAATTQQHGADQRPLAYLDLFAGSTLGRVGLDSVLHLLGADPARFVASAFVEIDDDLARKAEASWGRPSPRRGARPPHRFLEHDVWSLLLPTGEDPRQGLRIDPFLHALPEHTVLIVTSGSPCKQVSRASRNRGIDGILGPHSRCFWAVPLLCWYIRHRRPDLSVHLVQEMVDTILPVHLKAMLDTLGVEGATHNLHLDSGEWAPLPRRRFWIGTFPIPTPGDTVRFPRIRNPWLPGWGFHWDGVPPAATCARGEHGDVLLPSTYQGHPACLLYNLQHPLNWDLMNMRQVVCRIRGLLLPDEVERTFPGVRAGFELIVDFHERHGDGEDIARQFLLWVAERGPSHGLRFPHQDERARSLGLGDFLNTLQLSPRQLYDVVGSHFDPRALQRRMFPLLRDWCAGAPVASHPFPSPAALNGIYTAASEPFFGNSTPSSYQYATRKEDSLPHRCDAHSRS